MALTAESALPLQKETTDRKKKIMPYKSDAQRRFFNVNRDKMEKHGVDVDEWNRSSKGKDLPERAKGTQKPKRKTVGQMIAEG
jgi:hypothetical protein